jgi:DNA polymerase-4
MQRKIIHLDLDAFFCAVEEQRDPSLHGKPFAVGGRPDQRGVVASCSYAARQFGVRSAMPMGRALRLCPKLIIVGGHYKDYREASHKVMEIMRRLTPLVEQISIDEAFIDLSELPDEPEDLAHRLQAEINNSLGLPCSLGVATNKLVAKIATDTGKAASLKRSGTPNPPNAITVVPPGEEAEFLAPLPAQALWGVGLKTAERLAELGIHTIGEIASWPVDDLIRRFGKHGAELSRHAQGISESQIITEHEAKSISQETTFVRDIKDPDQLRLVLREQSEQVGKLLRSENLKGRTVKLKLRWHDFTTLTRQVTLAAPTDQDEEICRAVLELFYKLWQNPRPVRLLGVGVSHFDLPAPTRQLSLWDVKPADEPRLQKVLSELQERYGKTTVRRGSDLLKP